MRSAREEAEMVIFSAVRDVLEKTKLRPSQVSGFTPARGWNCLGFVHVVVWSVAV